MSCILRSYNPIIFIDMVLQGGSRWLKTVQVASSGLKWPQVGPKLEAGRPLPRPVFILGSQVRSQRAGGSL